MPAAQQIAPQSLSYDKVCLIDGGVPRDPTYLRMGEIRFPLQYYSHSQATAGIISNTLSHSISAATIVSTAIDDYILSYGGTNPGMGTFEFCFDNGPTPVANMSMSFDDVNYSGDAPSETETDFYTDFLATKRAPFPLYVMSAGNSAGFPETVPTPWVQNRGYNSLIVGASDDRGSPNIFDSTIAWFSSWVNPPRTHGDYELPNLVAPGIGIASANMFDIPDMLDSSPRTGCPSNLSGTSFSAPQATGVASLVFNTDPSSFYGFPEMLKAVLMASTSVSVDGAGFTSLSSSPSPDRKDGVGVLDAQAAIALGSSSYRSCPGCEAMPRGRWAGTFDLVNGFDSNGYSTQQWNLVADRTGRMKVIGTWTGFPLPCNFSDPIAGTYFPQYCNSNELDADLDLVVWNLTAGTWCVSGSWDSSWEGCDMQVTNGDRLTVKMFLSAAYNSSTVLAVAWNNYPIPLVARAAPAVPPIGIVALVVVLLGVGHIVTRRRQLARAILTIAIVCAFSVSCGSKDRSSTDENTSIADTGVSSPDASLVDAGLLTSDVPITTFDAFVVTTPEGGADGTIFDVGTPSVEGGSCSTVGFIGTPDEITQTPRAQYDVELAALHLDRTELTAKQSVYDRIATDLTAIRGTNSDIASSNESTGGWILPSNPYSNGKAVLLTVDTATSTAMRAGTYNYWSCLNSYYGFVTAQYSGSGSDLSANVNVLLKGVYDIDKILGLYGSLPGVIATHNIPYSQPYDAPHMCVNRTTDETYQYAILAAYGDCLSGCMYKKLYCYQSSAAGAVTLVAEGTDGGASTQCLGWYNTFCQ